MFVSYYNYEMYIIEKRVLLLIMCYFILVATDLLLFTCSNRMKAREWESCRKGRRTSKSYKRTCNQPCCFGIICLLANKNGTMQLNDGGQSLKYVNKRAAYDDVICFETAKGLARRLNEVLRLRHLSQHH